MFIGQHEVVNGRCLYCGYFVEAIADAHHRGAPLACAPIADAPKSTARVYAVDDFDLIQRRVAEIASERAQPPAEVTLSMAVAVPVPIVYGAQRIPANIVYVNTVPRQIWVFQGFPAEAVKRIAEE